MDSPPDELWIRRLLDVGRSLVTELDLDLVLDQVLTTAREITGARYAAVGVLNERRTELAQFLTSGIDEETRRAIGELPRGRGVLGVLIEHPEPLRLPDVGMHPRSYGFPTAHPAMSSFLGVPVAVRGEVWGNLYLAEKEGGGEFTEHDEQAAVILADWAAVAIDNARLFEVSELRRQELEKAVRGLEATRDVAVAIGGEIALEHVLELIAKRGRALVGARSLVIMLREGPDLVVHAGAGHVHEVRGARLPIDASTSGQVLQRGRPERVVDVDARLGIAPAEFGVEGAQTALLVPMLYRGDAVGVLAAFDRGEDAGVFSEDDEQTLRTFAASAATAVALAQSVMADRLRSAQAAADAERSRWARELHDETLQGLGGLRVLLSAALRRDDLEVAQGAMRDAVQRIEQEIGNLRSIITDLRPAALDELGLHAAIESLLDRHHDRSGLEIEADVALGRSLGATERLDAELEVTVYRLVQEALTNVVKHAGAQRVVVAICESDGELLVEVKDDGRGFDTATVDQGFGLAGMRERVGLAGGTMNVESGEAGTVLTARLPARRADQAPPASTAQAPISPRRSA
ncbi:MAG TPA: GAF domain-containing sensor histidine kinase [Solirubrobacteraceae bacterium]|jgi:signal transduction histidine kinase|nr:GAF domain-containing sensor histidine kinase [Solirubrobacteraceae bacterium]